MNRPLALSSSALVLVLAGCGGRAPSSPSARTVPNATLAEVKAAITDLQSGLDHVGLEARFLSIDEIDTGSPTIIPPDVGDPVFGTPEDPVPTFYYNDGVQAWEQVTITDALHREDYYLDEAKTQAAGYYEAVETGDR